MRFMYFIMRSFALGTVAIALVFFLSPAVAQDEPKEPPKLAEDIHETIAKVPVTVTLPSGKSHTGQMIVTHFRPQGDGPFPIVIMNHGRDGSAEKRAQPPRQRYTSVARYWIRRGFAVFVPTRLGYGETGLDPDPEFQGACASAEYGRPLAVTVEQIAATAKFARTLPWVDAKRLIVMGQSAGGFGSIGASAANLPGLVAAINFAGGRGGNPEKNPGKPCAPEQLAALYGQAGKNAKAPMLWLYAQNDKYWGPQWPGTWHAAYVKAGGRAELKTFPPVSEDGHTLLNRGFRLWRPVVDQFMAKLGVQPPKSDNAPPATSFARIDDAGKLPYVKDTVKTDGYQKFLDADLPRAFAIASTGGWSWRTGENAPKEALERCEQNAKQSCRLYAVDDAVVWNP